MSVCWLLSIDVSEVLQERDELRQELTSLSADVELNKDFQNSELLRAGETSGFCTSNTRR